MTTYTGKKAVVNRPVADVFDRFSNLSYLRDSIDRIPAGQLEQIGGLRLDADSLIITVPQFGDIRFSIIESRPTDRVVYQAENFPLPLNISIGFASLTPESTEVTTAIDVDIPAIMRPFVGSKIQWAADHFSDIIAKLNP